MAAEQKFGRRSRVSQIVGHTTHRSHQRARRGKNCCSDVGAAVSAHVGAFVKRPTNEDKAPDHGWRRL